MTEDARVPADPPNGLETVGSETATRGKVVGIGASAGGLTALQVFFANVPDDTGLAYVVVVHLSPEHQSHLPELLQADIGIPVRQVTDSVLLEPNHVYVIPPNYNLDTVDTHLRLSTLEPDRQQRAPIDHFFRALSESHEGFATGVILTGTGSDGALGMRAIKERGGLTLVQDPDEAEYPGMPRSALATGVVDLALPVAELPGAIVRFTQTQPRLVAPADGLELNDADQELMAKVFRLVAARTGRDFGRYKKSTLLRRLTRRMQLNGLEKPADYLELIRERPEELQKLVDGLLITVTQFFRDPEVFDALEKKIVPALFEGKGPMDEIRVWSAGCATGEEAYSVAILLMEEASRQEEPPFIQIFASDLHDAAIEMARRGRFSEEIENDVPAERLKRYFTKVNGRYQISGQIRDMVVFSPHNLLRDPPFSRLDLILCRNLLIYLESDVQGEVIELFHYALKPDGLLVLGTAESIGGQGLFKPVDKELHVYRRQDVPALEPRLPVFSLIRRSPEYPAVSASRLSTGYGPLYQRMLDRFGPATLLVNPDDVVVHLSVRAGPYLVQPGGELTSVVTKLVRDELRNPLRMALRQARETGIAVRSGPIPSGVDSLRAAVTIEVLPSPKSSEVGFALVVFTEERGVAPDPRVAATENDDGDHPADSRRVRELEHELDLTRTRLQTVIHDGDASQEDMQASNEELQSMNEELRSTMEELETSKEELQSINEELQTVNQENRNKVEELAQLSDDLKNLLVATRIATLFLDRELRILRFTPRVARLFNVKDSDQGRPISDLTHRLGYDGLKADAQRVLDQLEVVEREVQDQDGSWYLTRIMPYRSSTDHIAGVVLTFVDITSRKALERDLLEARDYAEDIVATLQEPLLVLDSEFRVRTANPAFYREFETTPDETLRRSVYRLAGGHWDLPELRALLERGPDEGLEFHDFEVTTERDGRADRTLVFNGRHLDPQELILLEVRDVTQERQLAELVRQTQRLESVGRLAGGIAHDFNNLLTAVEGHATLLLDRLPEDSDVRPDLEQIRDAGRRAARLTHQLLVFSREQVQQKRNVALGAATLDMEKILARLISERIELKMEVEAPDPVVHIDPNQLQQVILNLVVNAAEATEATGAIHVTVDAMELSEKDVGDMPEHIAPGPYGRLVVRDEGRGIDPDALGHLFEPFFTTKDAQSGRGLGLATVFGIVSQGDGHILVDSAPGRGSSFEVVLPRVTGEPDPPHDAPASDDTRGQQTEGQKVLLVEDETVVRKVLARMLGRSGHEVVCAADGAEALTLLKAADSEDINLVLSDIVMPNLGGIELATELTELRPEIPVILMSGYASEDMRVKIDSVATAFLAKPFTLAELLECIAGVLAETPA